MDLSILQRRVLNQTVPFEDEYQAVLDRAVFLGYDLPSSDQQTKQNQVVIDLKTVGVWDKLDIFYLMANNAGKEFAQLNWKSPENFQLTDVNFVSPFIVNQGLQGSNNNGEYITTNWNGLNNGINFTLNNASYYSYIAQIATPPRITIPFSNGSQRETIRLLDEVAKRITNAVGNINSSFNHTNQSGMKSINRTTSSDVWLSNDKTGEFRLSNSVALNGLSMSLCVFNIANYSSDVTLSMFSAGASLVSENNDYVDIIQNYLDSL